jgi:hypothetical protein
MRRGEWILAITRICARENTVCGKSGGELFDFGIIPENRMTGSEGQK